MSSVPTLAPAPVTIGARAASAAARIAAVETVIGAIGERLDRPFELEEMARIAFLSPFYFNRVFRQVTGLPPRRFQTALRMVAAKRMLLTSDLSVTEICLEVGYRSLGTFVTQFRELVGVSPRTLRRLGERPWSLTSATPPTPTPDGATVTGVIEAADETPRITLVGAFPEASPQGVPRACTILSGTGVRSYRLTGVPSGKLHVAAAAIPWSEDPRSYLLPDEASVRVAVARPALSVQRGCSDTRDLRMRPRRTTDPPILLVPQALLGVR